MQYKTETAFLRALVAGALIGGAPWLVVTAPLGASAIAGGDILGGLFALALPILVAGFVTLACMLVIGLPLTALLASKGRECPRIYAFCGGIFGFLVPATALLLLNLGTFEWHRDFVLLTLGGTIAGAATAFVWGKHRKRLRDQRRLAATATNPIHDLLF